MNTMSSNTISSISSSSSSTTSTTSRRKKSLTERQMNDIRETYQDIIGRKMPIIIERQVMTELLDDETESTVYDWYIYALEETASAPQPSWRYTQAIMRRLQHGMSSSEYKQFTLPY